MNIFEYIRIKCKKIIDKKSNKKIGSGEEEKQTQGREKFIKEIKENPVYNRNSCIYNILKHYKLSEEFARNVMVQEEVKSIFEDKVYNEYRHRNIELLSIDEIINLLERDITIRPNCITIRDGSIDENSIQIYFINIFRTRKGIKILEEDIETYKTYCTINKKNREYNKYNVLMKRINETEEKNKYEEDRNIHNIVTITRSEDNPFIMFYELEDKIGDTKYAEKIYYSDIDSCLDLQEPSIYENGYELEKEEEDVSDFYTEMFIEKIKSLDTFDAKNFLCFCRREYPKIFYGNQTIIE